MEQPQSDGSEYQEPLEDQQDALGSDEFQSNDEAIYSRSQSPPHPSLKIKISKTKTSAPVDMHPHRITRSSTRPPEPTRDTRLRSRSGRSDISPANDLGALSQRPRTTRSGRNVALSYVDDFPDDDDDDDPAPRELGRRKPKKAVAKLDTDDERDFVVRDEADDVEPDAAYPPRNKTQKLPPPSPAKTTRKATSRKAEDDGDADFQLTEKSELESDDGISHDEDAPVTSPSPEPQARRLTRRHRSPPSPRGYTLRPQRKEINYQIPPPLDNDTALNIQVNGRSKGRARPRAPFTRNGSQGILGSFATLPAPPPVYDDSDSDDPNRQAGKSLPGPSGSGGGLIGGGGLTAGDLAAAAGTPANFGKVSKDSVLADTDPLGVNHNVSFDEVGGLDEHIASLKEMVTLPLLYPEIFQQFKITPPRGVLFHGPPGTGKTLLARALAASSRSGGRDISFFMRKGADILSKWVGEAERQLRLLFEEAKASQPSIIFFDEIDGLAPVRSSKQDQIHASIVSTLLALMDGMDGRGQVIVIGATNRPDAIDPALRRPGRFDREFYFPLPDLVARRRILQILTRGWEGWDGEKGGPMLQVLAEATKGYGGADLRALATEATLNAVQRTYPQIYKSKDRLLVKPDTIRVLPKDFMISVKKIVASSARSAASTAAPLPPQLVPLLAEALERIKCHLDKVLPSNKKRNVLEEAEWEDDESEDGSFEREMRLQAMETLRIHRPRLLLHGSPGMGQGYLGAAALHHLEGFHVQSLDLGNLHSDSTRSVEAAIVQLFVEAKRHKPSIIYVPSLIGLSSALSDVARNTMKEMIDSIPPTDAVLIFGVVNGPLEEVPRDIREWFGASREARISLTSPSPGQREAFFREVMADVDRPPNQFPDAYRRKKRVLEVLPIAPPLPPRQPSAAELAAQIEKDQQTINALRVRLGPILQDLKKRFRRFTRSVEDAHEAARSYQVNVPDLDLPTAPAEPIDVEMIDAPANGSINLQPESVPFTNGIDAHVDPVLTGETSQPTPPTITLVPTPAPTVALPAPAPPPLQKVYDIDLDKMLLKLFEKGYLTPTEFLKDLSRIVHNTRIEPCNVEHAYKAHQMYSEAEAVTWDPQFKLECERVAAREKVRRAAAKAEAEKAAPKDGEAKTPNGSELSVMGTRRSARANGEKVEITLTDPVQLERSLKRQRADGATSSGSGDDGLDGPSKKARVALTDEDADGEVDMDVSMVAPGAIHTLSEAVPDGRGIPPRGVMDVAPIGYQSGSPFAPPIIISNPETISSAPPLSSLMQNPPLRPSLDGPIALLSPANAESTPSAASPAPVVSFSKAPSPIATRSPSPAPPPPEFITDLNKRFDLRRLVEDETSGLTVEQLEQLRAMCLDCVWRRRADWNRTEMIEEMTETVKGFIHHVTVDDLPSSP